MRPFGDPGDTLRMRFIEQIHEGYVHDRRTHRLARHFAELIPPGSSVLDVGCGDGLLAGRLKIRRPDLEVRGIDILVRDRTVIPVDPFDGRVIPHGAARFDVVMFVDVLHHTEDPTVLLREAARVAGRAIVIKDHTAEGLLAFPTLRFMDRVSNARHGVVLPYNYWREHRWRAAFAELGLGIETWRTELGLYPWPASWVFGRSLHFIARLDVRSPHPSDPTAG
jgi:SAM-dependent methyltransferase